MNWRRPFPHILKIGIFLLWLILFAALLHRDFFIDEVGVDVMATIKQAEAVEYQSILFKNDKIGYVRNEYSQGEKGLWQLVQDVVMNLNVSGKTQQISLHLVASFQRGSQLESFTFSFRSPFYTMHAKGSVHGNTVKYQLQTASGSIDNSLHFSSPPILPASRREYLLQANMKKGEKRKIPRFDPFTLSGKESIVEYLGVEPLRVGGRVRRLHHFYETFSGMRVNFWLDDDGRSVREESPAGFVFIREPEFKALAMNGEGAELLSAVAVQPEDPMPNSFQQLSQLRYRLQLPADIDFSLNSGRQHFSDGILTVKKEQLSAIGEGQCREVSHVDLATSPYIQADNAQIIKQAKALVAGASNTVEKVRRLTEWLYVNIDKRPVLGLPDAVSTLTSKQGDCNEHAVLFAAFARAIGIPARIAVGVSYAEWGKAFYYHAWNEVCIGSRWISLDSTTNQFPADIGHLKFLTGGIEEQMRIGALLGRLKIAPIFSQSREGAKSTSRLQE